MSVRAAYYDGLSARRREVWLQAVAGRLALSGEGVERSAGLAELAISERLGSAPRQVRFSDGAFCEIHDVDGLARLLEGLGYRDAAVTRWQRSLPMMAASAALVVLVSAAGYRYGLPWAAAEAAARAPPAFAAALSRQTLASLDAQLLRESRLPAARREQLRDGFAALKRPDAGGAIDLRFRDGSIGPNAFALPDGTVVMLDALVALAADDAQLYAVLAHELGHVRHRHGLRSLFQGSAVTVIAAWWLGDISALLATAPAALMQARYSRGFEAEADAYAAALLRANGLPTSHLADILEKMTAAHGMQAGASRDWTDYLSSHPAPRERLQALRAP